jgi:hypothetical protein
VTETKEKKKDGKTVEHASDRTYEELSQQMVEIREALSKSIKTLRLSLRKSGTWLKESLLPLFYRC